MKEYKYIVLTSYTPESDDDSGLDVEYYETLEMAREYAIHGATIAKIIEENEK